MHSKLCEVSKAFLDHHDHFTEERLQELYPKLRRYCQFLSQNSWDGEDLVQESLIKAWHHYKHQPEISTALLNRIARNEWIDTVRNRSKESFEAIPDQAYDESKQIADRFEAIQKLMNQLTPKQTVMFALKEGFQFQISEIAELLNTTETAVKAAIYRSKQRMAKQESNVTNPLIKQYWEMEDQEQIQRILHESFLTQDPSILIRSIPFIRTLRKDTRSTCSMHKSRLSNFPSCTVYMVA